MNFLTKTGVVLLLGAGLLPSSVLATGACSPDFDPGVDASRTGAIAILATIPADATWASLADDTKRQLQALADKRLEAFRASWSTKALAAKEKILTDCPTAEMSSAMDEYFRQSYPDTLDENFTVGGVAEPLRHVLIKTYLSAMASYRSENHYSTGLPDKDWDGASKFDSIRLPDAQSYGDIMAYARSAVEELRRVDDATLGEQLSRLKQSVLFGLRSQAEGSIGDGFGGFDMERVYQRIWEDGDILDAYGDNHTRLDLFRTDDEVLTEANAYYLGNIPLRGLDRGTLRGALEYKYYTNPDAIAQKIGDPAKSFVAQRMIQMKNWWVERTEADPAARGKCTIYSQRERDNAWEAFTADALLNNDGKSSMDELKANLDRYRDNMIGRYRKLAREAIDKVFPDDKVLNATERQTVVSWINKQTKFGVYRQAIAAELDAAQGTMHGKAATLWSETFSSKVQYLGGYKSGDHITNSDEATAQKMLAQVKDWVGKEYSGYPVDVRELNSLLPPMVVTTASNSSTRVLTAQISFGIGTPRSLYEHYSTLLHELRHALSSQHKIKLHNDPRTPTDNGYAVEGSANAVERLVLERFASTVIKDDVALALYKLEYGVRDARIVGVTDATLSVFYRIDCSGDAEPDTVDLVRQVVAGYGLAGDLAENAVRRAHTGTGYLLYAYGERLILDDIAYLETQFGIGGQHRIDPYVLFACGLNTPSRAPGYAAKLRACLKIP